MKNAPIWSNDGCSGAREAHGESFCSSQARCVRCEDALDQRRLLDAGDHGQPAPTPLALRVAAVITATVLSYVYVSVRSAIRLDPSSALRHG